MHTRTPIAAAVLTAAALAGPAVASAAPPAPASAPVRHVTVSPTSIRIGGPAHYRPGPVTFKVAARGGPHVLHLLQFRRGFTLADLKIALRTPRQTARRVLAHVRFLGGVDVFPGAPGTFTQTLHEGTYYAGELDGRVRLRAIHVHGRPVPDSAAPKSSGVITAYDFGWRVSRKTLPAHGTVTLRSTGHQPHSLVLAPVKPGTTRAQIGAYLRSTGAREQAPPPSFALEGPEAATVLLSPGTRMKLTYDLPPGEYAMLTFAPDYRNGKRQALEGMYGVTTLH
jgi:hypothetical protein